MPIKRPFDDDGRTIAPMDVPGTYRRISGTSHRTKSETAKEAPQPLTRNEKLAFTWGVVKATALVAAVFGTVYLLFILFCLHVWLK